MDDCNRVAASDLIIIITTSPIQSNPSTAIIDMAIQSIFKQPTLDDVAIHIICDGAKMALDSVNKYKSGIITEQRLLSYEQFKLNLGLKYKGNKRIVIQQRQSRFCFAKNIKYVMQKVEHQFVLIFQHDHVLMRTVDIAHIVEKMRKHPINYVGFMSKSVQKLAYQLDENMNLRQYFSAKVGYVPQLVRHSHQEFERKVVSYYQELYELPLMPLIFWYDKVHIAKRKYYLDVIFDKGFYDENKQVYQKTISFVEDSFGCFMRKAIRRKPQRFEELSAFIYWDSMQCLVFHSHGRNYLSKESKQILQEQHRKGRQESSLAKASSKSQQFEYYNLQMLDG